VERLPLLQLDVHGGKSRWQGIAPH
jgi:hypothetical protein